jgi:hypothetical protein
VTSPSARFATVLANPGAATTADAVTRLGTVVSVGPPVRVDTGGLSLSCISFTSIAVSDSVYVSSFGDLNLILGSAIDIWHNIGAGGEPAFQNSWVNFGSGYVGARFRKEQGRVFVEGTIKSGATATVAWTFPAGYRPATEIQRQIRGTDGTERLSLVDIQPGGNMQIVMAGAVAVASAVSLGFDYAVD